MPESPGGIPALSVSDPRGESRGQRRIGVVVCALVFLVLAVFGAVKIQYGLDFTDPGSHIGAATRYQQGDLPFRDEWNHSVCSFDIILWGFLKICPDVGLYEVRALAIVLKLTWLLAIVLLLKRHATLWPIALACIPVAFMTRGVYSPGYNELGQFGLFTALPLWLYACCRRRQSWRAAAPPVLAGICFTVGVLSYAPMILILAAPICVFLIDCLRRISPPGVRPATRIFLGVVLLSLTAFATVLLATGLLDDFYNAARWHIGVAFGQASGTPSEATALDRVRRLCGGWLPFLPHFIGVLLFLWLALFAYVRRVRTAWPGSIGFAVIAAALLVVVWTGGVEPPIPPRPWGPRFEADFWIVLTALALSAVAFVMRQKIPLGRDAAPRDVEWTFVHRIFLGVALLYLLVQITFSTNKLLNSMFAAPALFLLGAAHLGRSFQLASAGGEKHVARCRFAALAVLTGVLGFFQLQSAYRLNRGNEPMSEMTADFSHKYLRGIKSTPERVASLEALLGFLEPRLRPGDFLHQEDDCPMLYFLLRSRPALPRIWSPARRGFPEAERRRMLDFMLEHDRIPQYYVRWNRLEPIPRLQRKPQIVAHLDGSKRTLDPDDPIWRYFQQNYRRVARFGQFEVFEYADSNAGDFQRPIASMPATLAGAYDEVTGKLFELVPDWNFAGRQTNSAWRRDERDTLRISLDLGPDEKSVLAPGDGTTPRMRLLTARRQYDFRLSVELADHAEATLTVYICSDETKRSILTGKRMPLRNGLNHFTVYTADAPVYIWPVFQLAGRGEATVVDHDGRAEP